MNEKLKHKESSSIPPSGGGGAIKYIKDVVGGVKSLFTGMKLTGWYALHHGKEKITQQYPDRAAVHADKDGLFVVHAHNVVNCRLHSYHHVIGALTAFDLQLRISEAPLFKHVMVISVFLGSHPMAFFGTPAYFV